MNQLYDRYLGPKWREEPADASLWERTESIPAGELWRTHERRRERLVADARQRLRIQLVGRGAPQTAIEAADEVLSPDALTIGFGRRFATYKRANLLIRDPKRLERILNNVGWPVQIIYAGKAHPHDNLGKQIHPVDCGVSQPSGVSTQNRVPGKLRHGDCPLHGPRLRRLVKHAASPAGSQRHKRHESSGERRAQPEHAGWMVG